MQLILSQADLFHGSIDNGALYPLTPLKAKLLEKIMPFGNTSASSVQGVHPLSTDFRGIKPLRVYINVLTLQLRHISIGI